MSDTLQAMNLVSQPLRSHQELLNQLSAFHQKHLQGVIQQSRAFLQGSRSISQLMVTTSEFPHKKSGVFPHSQVQCTEFISTQQYSSFENDEDGF
ncbi:hypothetical protein TRICI_001117 [Trichomonascus ciferrii]|uniref:Uncharacterized protein n=1 Tax=Trichomonascus ciferrii TaxID=44093 RepID=A0A642VA65_9ASCO|nr:hypothetical protein TRICI_001117 [Trichomonascus ciferrii]